MRIAHVGNIASNAYLNAKRDRAMGIESDCFDHGAGPAQWTPPWEDADWNWPENLKPTDAPDWRQITFTNGWERPVWCKSLGWNGGPSWFDRVDDDYYRQFGALDESSFTNRYIRDEPIKTIAAEYDLVILYGPDAGYGTSLNSTFVTLECSTMRSTPKRNTPDRRVLAAAYQRAAQNIITNADCWRAAGELGIQDYSRFIPHPIDLEKFSARRKGIGAEHRERLLAALDGPELLFLAPARQQANHEPDAKGNHKILAAFARYVRESEPQGAPRAGLLLLKWGNNVPEMHAWIDALGLVGRVAWLDPVRKVVMPYLYDACDIVLDQFAASVGSYGTSTVEALAMGKPVITHINRDFHAWCEDVCPVPPHHEALTTEQIWTWLTTLAHAPGARENAGNAGAEWAQTWCSPARLGALYGQLYEDVLG